MADGDEDKNTIRKGVESSQTTSTITSLNEKYEKSGFFPLWERSISSNKHQISIYPRIHGDPVYRRHHVFRLHGGDFSQMSILGRSKDKHNGTWVLEALVMMSILEFG